MASAAQRPPARAPAPSPTGRSAAVEHDHTVWGPRTPYAMKGARMTTGDGEAMQYEAQPGLAA